ncbi:carbohydrate ABC transporter permease [Actinomadura rudentiformis]|uniref:Sugar ABC transporter permease n=1 Tax=Actinomadura rudentiformis TaxID=359158 RepID=A0A6H9YUT3_9ACTN|nr:sugar ABC transporter permease [Actinomadura rudentiformis]KAB2349566.1 sugar ABC transporter permease [Actinomadura rudentiformis]
MRPFTRKRWTSAHWYAWTMVAPVAIVMGVLVGYPLVRGVYLSLTDANEANVGRTIGMNEIPATYSFVGLDNYLQIMQDDTFWLRLGWTALWTLACVFLHVSIGLGLAMLLNRRVRFRGVYRMLLVLPWAAPAFVSTFIWRYLLNHDFGLANGMLRAAGLPAVNWLDDPTMAKISVITVNVWLGVAFNMVALLGGLQSIPGELYEASRVDGASAWQQFRNITLPMLRPVSQTVILIGTIWTFNQFPVIFLLTRGGPDSATEILVTAAYRDAFTGIRDYSGAAANGLVILALLVIMAWAYRRSLRKHGEVWG